MKKVQFGKYVARQNQTLMLHLQFDIISRVKNDKELETWNIRKHREKALVFKIFQKKTIQFSSYNQKTQKNIKTSTINEEQTKYRRFPGQCSTVFTRYFFRK